MSIIKAKQLIVAKSNFVCFVVCFVMPSDRACCDILHVHVHYPIDSH